jgi:hypothetical protein
MFQLQRQRHSRLLRSARCQRVPPPLQMQAMLNTRRFDTSLNPITPPAWLRSMLQLSRALHSCPLGSTIGNPRLRRTRSARRSTPGRRMFWQRSHVRTRGRRRRARMRLRHCQPRCLYTASSALGGQGRSRPHHRSVSRSCSSSTTISTTTNTTTTLLTHRRVHLQLGRRLWPLRRLRRRTCRFQPAARLWFRRMCTLDAGCTVRQRWSSAAGMRKEESARACTTRVGAMMLPLVDLLLTPQCLTAALGATSAACVHVHTQDRMLATLPSVAFLPDFVDLSKKMMRTSLRVCSATCWPDELSKRRRAKANALSQRTAVT